MVDHVFIVWTDDCSVGHAELDGHHKKAVSIMNDLYAAIQGKHRVELNGILARLFEYAQLHFGREERLMAEHKFPGLPEHKVEHERMVRKIADLQRQGLHHKDCAASDAMSFLREWWLNHIRVMDSQYAPYMTREEV